MTSSLGDTSLVITSPQTPERIVIKYDSELRMGPEQSFAKSRQASGHFQEAAIIFGDPLALTFRDHDHSVTEERFITIGTSQSRRVLIVSHTENGENIRIISARKATLPERKQYEEEK